MNGVRKVLSVCWSPFLFPFLDLVVGKLLLRVPAYRYGLDPLRGVVAFSLPLSSPVHLLTSGFLVPFVWIASGSLGCVVSFVWI